MLHVFSLDCREVVVNYMQFVVSLFFQSKLVSRNLCQWGRGGIQLLMGSLFHGAIILCFPHDLVKYTATVSNNLHW